MTLCPCSSSKAFSDCCEPNILNRSAPTALALMRSRYTACTLVKAEYLHTTTHPKTRPDHKVSEIEAWAKENSWNRLEIISTEHGNRNDQRGIVEFKAFFTNSKGQAQVHHERSTFLKEDGQWFYVDGKFDPKPTDLSKKTSRNDPCPCGSGKKYKRCCG
ncbi:MAG: YchJ family protein [Roseivirga sp.]|nr:YchJ family protein [Roseivirga sp.]